MGSTGSGRSGCLVGLRRCGSSRRGSGSRRVTCPPWLASSWAPAPRGPVTRRGDMTEACLGLSPADYAALTKRIDRVVHVAATTHLGRPLAEARRRNVGGTTQALQLCRRIREHGKEGRLDYVSTAYVAGDRAD